jgi:hypothetical protein
MYYEAYCHGWFEGNTLAYLAKTIVDYYTDNGKWSDYHTPMITQFYVVDEDGDRTNNKQLEAELDKDIIELYHNTIEEIKSSIEHEIDERRSL